MPFHTYLVPVVGATLSLRVNGVNLFVALVHEDVLGSVLPSRPGGALRTAFLGPFFRAPAHVVGNPTGPEPSAGEQGSDKRARA